MLEDMPSFAPFVSVAEVERWRRSTSPPSLVDARAERAYAAGSLPGAVALPARDLNAPAGGVRRLVSAADLERHLSTLGVGAEPVIVYGARGGADAAHVWWTLHAYRHPAVYLLDGGVEAWRDAGLALDTSPVTARRPRTPFVADLAPDALIDLDELGARLGDPDLALVDTRAASEFVGEDVAARRGGHIPGARLLPWDDALGPDLRLKPEADLRRLTAPLFDAPSVALYCQSGVRAAHTYALLTALGHPGPRLYLASWAEWGNLAHTPVSTAPPSTETEIPS